MKVLRVSVAGATGYLGSRVVSALLVRGFAVTAIIRNRSESNALRKLLASGARIIPIDATRDEPYEEALLGADIAISCMASRNTGSNPADDFLAIDRDANIRFGNAALTCGVRHVVLIATFEGPASRDLSEFSAAKEDAVDAIRIACRAAGASFTVIRPTAYFSDLIDRAFDSVATHNRYTEVGDGSRRINPIDGDDVAELIRRHIEALPIGEHDIPVGGPDVMTFRDIGLLAAESLGRQRRLHIRSIPVTLLRVLAVLAAYAGTISTRMRRSAAILHWMIYVGTHDAVAPCTGRRHLRDVFAAMAVTRWAAAGR